MIVLEVNKKEYHVFESWSEITVKKARELNVVCNDIPETLNLLYKEKSKGSESDLDQVRIHTDGLKSIGDELIVFYSKVLECLSDIKSQVIPNINKNDLESFYNQYLMQYVFGVLYFPLEDAIDIQEFTKFEKTYYIPESEEVMGVERPFANEHAGVFCDASDLDSNGRNEDSKYKHAELITSIVFREKKKGQIIDYTEKESMKTAWMHKDILTCDIFHSALYQLSKVNSCLKLLFGNLYQGGDAKSSSASSASGLSDFGWLNSIMTVAEMGVLNQDGLTPLESVRQTDLYTFMTVLSNLRANSDFQRIYAEKNRK